MEQFKVKKEPLDMSNNEWEALQEKESAENLIVKKEYMCARYKLMKAQELFPGLNHIEAMITVCDILSAATNLTPSSIVEDYYWVLQVIPSSPLSDIKDRYHKLVTLLKPIKKKFLGTKLALKLVDHVFNLLSNKSKLSTFDSQKMYTLMYGENITRDSTQTIVPVPEKGNRVEEGMIEPDLSVQPYSMIQNINKKIKIEEVKVESSSFTPMINCSTGEVWAVYSGSDSMPRRYIVIDNVISETQVNVRYLENQHVNEYTINLPIACGDYRPGGNKFSLEMSRLSHRVNCRKSMELYEIYPRKGEIWALYGGWNSMWKRSDYENCEYWVVEILSEVLEGENMMVSWLRKVKGWFTFYERQQFDGFDMIRTISETEAPSFSHQIPAFKVPEINIPENSWHLDPNALTSKHR